MFVLNTSLKIAGDSSYAFDINCTNGIMWGGHNFNSIQSRIPLSVTCGSVVEWLLVASWRSVGLIAIILIDNQWQSCSIFQFIHIFNGTNMTIHARGQRIHVYRHFFFLLPVNRMLPTGLLERVSPQRTICPYVGRSLIVTQTFHILSLTKVPTHPTKPRWRQTTRDSLLSVDFIWKSNGNIPLIY